MTPVDVNRENIVATEIRRFYNERKNILLNNKHNPKTQKFDHWLKAARTCMELNASPENYVNAAFHYSRESAGPYYTAMAGTAARAWYRKYMISKEAEAKLSNGDNDTGEQTNVETLQMDIDHVKKSILKLTGSDDISEKAVEYLGSMMLQFPPHVRVLLGYKSKNEKIKKFFGEAAGDYFNNNPSAYRAAEVLGYPIREILLWLHAPMR